MMDRTALIAHIDAGVIMLGAVLIVVMRMDMLERAGRSEIICDVVLSLDIMPKVGYQQRHQRGKLGNQKETQEPGSKSSQLA
jgi:hypothetical protein